jgi:GAF domain-containing protein
MQELESAVARVRKLYGAAACSFAQVEPDGATLRFVAADGAGAEAIVGVTLPVGRGIAGWAALSGEPIKVADVATDDRFARDVAESTRYVPSTMLVAPVVDEHGETAGVIEVLDPVSGRHDSGQDLAVLGLVADQLASVIRLAAMYDALGTGLLRTLADPSDSESFDAGLAAALGADEGAGLREVAHAFRDLAEQGPAEAELAQRVLREVAAYASRRR